MGASHSSEPDVPLPDIEIPEPEMDEYDEEYDDYENEIQWLWSFI